MELTIKQKKEIVEEAVILLLSAREHLIEDVLDLSVDILFICNAIQEAIHNKYSQEDVVNIEEFMPELYYAIAKHGKKLHSDQVIDYDITSPWMLPNSSLNIKSVDYRINWLQNFKKEYYEEV